jgi:acyl carrier protein
MNQVSKWSPPIDCKKLMNYKSEIKKFVLANLLFGDGADLRDDTSLLDSGTVDSTGVLEIIMFLEDTYKIKVEPEETVPENLDSIERISEFLTRKLGVPTNQPT